MRSLKEVRVDIDELDSKLKELYIKRLLLTKEVAEYKATNNLPIFDKTREELKIENIAKDIKDPEIKSGIERMLMRLMSDSKRLQHDLLKDEGELFGYEEIVKIDSGNSKVVYQGEPGAYSQMAAKAFFGETKSLKNVATWREAMNAIRSEEADYCVLPIENSIAGSVTEIYDLMPEYNFSIIGEQIIPIEHMLLGVHGSTTENIKAVYSHPQALLQCDGFLQSHSQMTPMIVKNTALAAKTVRDLNDKSLAAIAGEINASIYNLKILERKIQDEDNNQTRFVILSRGKVYIKDAKKLSISFLLKHEKGNLFNALSYINDNDINLSLIESRPVKNVNWEYRFFLDIEGNLKDKNVRRALFELSSVTKDLVILGNY